MSGIFKTIFISHSQLFRKEKWHERVAYFTTRSHLFEASNFKAYRVVEDTARFNEFKVKVTYWKTIGNISFYSSLSI